MKLKPLVTIHADLKPFTDTGRGPYGSRLIFDVTGGHFEGAYLKGTILPSGGDWFLVDNEGVGHLDVRLTMETDDGARIYVQYYGVLVMDKEVNKALAQGKEPEYGDTYFMTQPRFETGDARYKWLNRTVAAGEGRQLPGAVEYRMFELVNE